MNAEELRVYEPDLGLDGTIPQLVDWAVRYTGDYSDEALLRISELAKAYGFDREDYINIPLLLVDERKRENSEEDTDPYERMKIDQYIYGSIGYSASDGKGGETEIRSEDDKVLICLSGVDEDGVWSAVNAYPLDEFMGGEYNWLSVAIGETLYYGKRYEEENK